MNVKQLKELLDQFDENLQVGSLDSLGSPCAVTEDDVLIVNRWGKDILHIQGLVDEGFV